MDSKIENLWDSLTLTLGQNKKVILPSFSETHIYAGLNSKDNLDHPADEKSRKLEILIELTELDKETRLVH